MIRSLTTYQFTLPMPYDREVRTALHTISGAEIVLVEITDCEGNTGIGYAMTFRRQQTEAVRMMIHDLVAFLSPDLNPRRQWRTLLNQLDFTGKAGIGMMALSAIDTALWDVTARSLGVPLHTLLGGDRAAIPLYVAGGWLSFTVKDLVDEVLGYRDEGYRRYKMKVGHPGGWREDLHRVGKVRAAVGDDFDLYVDANQSWNRIEALLIGRHLEDLDVAWFEEPVQAEDTTGSAAVARALDMPVVVGQSAHLSEIKRLIDDGAGDILMPDFMRCGGVTGWTDAAALAAASHTPITSHAFTEICVHLASAAPSATVAEYIPRWFDTMYDEPPLISEDGMVLTALPGLGLEISAKTKARDNSGGVRLTLPF